MSNQSKKKKNNGILIALIIIALVVFAAIVTVGVLKNKAEEPDNQPVTEDMLLYGDETLGIDPDVDKALSDYRMIEIIGIDNGDRSDVIFVAAINKKTNDAKIFTVYRDTLMKVATKGKTYKWGGHEYTYYKCNRGYQKEGKYGTMKMLNSHLDLNIRELLGIDWDGVELLINKIGGITVNISDEVMGWMNSYYSKAGRDNAADYKTITHSGRQTIDGTQAVAYLRVRYDSDASVRSHRDEDVLLQVFNKIKPMSTEDKIKLYDEVADYFNSNMSRTTITELIASLTEMEINTYDGFPYEYEIMWDKWDAFYYWVAKDDLRSNVIKLHENVFNQNDYVPSATADSLNEELNTYIETLH